MSINPELQYNNKKSNQANQQKQTNSIFFIPWGKSGAFQYEFKFNNRGRPEVGK